MKLPIRVFVEDNKPKLAIIIEVKDLLDLLKRALGLNLGFSKQLIEQALVNLAGQVLGGRLEDD